MPLLDDYPELNIIRAFARRRKTHVFLVGGFLRDHLLHRPSLDFDFAVKKNAVSLARAFADKIKGAFILLDAEHGCARIVKKHHGEVRIFDFADYRAPTLSQDLLHRDFTINIFCLPVHTLTPKDEIKDVLQDLKSGQADLKAKRIRMTSPSVFREDPLRILRAYSLRAVLGFAIEPKTQARIKKDQTLIRTVSFERVRDELFKILESPRAAQVIREMDRAGVLVLVIPEVAVMEKVEQGGYHHLDVWNHSLEALVQLEGVLKEFEKDADVQAYLSESLAGPRTRRALLKLGILLHDIGKPQTRKKEETRYSFHGHEHVGKTIVRKVAKSLKLSTRERYILEDMVLLHLRPGYLSNFKRPSERAIFRYQRDAKTEGASIALLSLADQRATRGPLTSEEDQTHHEAICRDMVRRFFEREKKQPVERLITGHDLIKKLKLTPSPIFAKILNAVEEQQATGQVTNKEEALALARKMAASPN